MSEIFKFKESEFDNIKDCLKYIREDCEGDVGGKEFLVTRIISTGEDQWGTYSESRQEIELQLLEEEK
jgi:hypothetical protein|tara:strand:- start:437 stop:640 length:204 start_codon:yes stop_codon:yes gene_type:complete